MTRTYNMRVGQLVVLFFCISYQSGAQTINNTALYRNITSDSYVRYLYENDYFSATDEYYTQGLYLEFVLPGFRKLPTNKLMWKPLNAAVKYGLAVQHNVYTPQSISDLNIRYGDRPYASSLMLQSFSIATDTIKKYRLSSTISIGVMGRIAGGGWMQYAIHKATDNTIPRGWHYQIANDVVLNYRTQYEKTVFQVDDVLMVNANASADVGTLLIKANMGGSLQLGYFSSPYSSRVERRFSIYAYLQPLVNFVGYDASLQGGWFNRNNVYTVAAKDVSRVVLENRYGIVIGLGRFYLEYFRQNIGREFAGGGAHGWGGIQLGVKW